MIMLVKTVIGNNQYIVRFVGLKNGNIDKMYALKQLSSKLADMKGTLYMENYDGTSSSIIFKKEN